jgi:hypothetical protein
MFFVLFRPRECKPPDELYSATLCTQFVIAVCTMYVHCRGHGPSLLSFQPLSLSLSLSL